MTLMGGQNMFLFRNISFLYTFLFLFLLSSCGGGGMISLGGSGGGSGDDEPSKTDVFGKGAKEFEGSSGSLGTVTITTDTNHYETMVTVGETMPIGINKSDSGIYELQSLNSF